LQEHDVSSVRGNHDRWAVERGRRSPDEFGGGMPAPETLDFLRDLPFDLVVADHSTIGVVVHGSPRCDMEFVSRESHSRQVLRGYLLDVQCEVLVVGHTHRPMWFRCPDGLVINPGSVVSRAVVDSSRTFALVDLSTLDVTFHDVETGKEVEVEPWS
jgi:predicted phosphodiesterase